MHCVVMLPHRNHKILDMASNGTTATTQANALMHAELLPRLLPLEVAKAKGRQVTSKNPRRISQPQGRRGVSDFVRPPPEGGRYVLLQLLGRQVRGEVCLEVAPGAVVDRQASATVLQE